MNAGDRQKLETLVERMAEADFGGGGLVGLRSLGAYLEANPEQVEEHLALAALWEELGQLEEPAAEAPAAAPEPRRGWLGFEAHRMAAAILPLFAVIGLLLLAIGNFRGDGAMELRTMAGERRIVTLADGSTISLSPSSLVRVTMEKDGRRLQLAEGEAMFEVAHDPERPFTVSAGNGEVRAIGTAFNIRLAGPEVVVTVVEGTISVTAGEAEAQPAKASAQRHGLTQLAKAGQQVTYGERAGRSRALASDSFITPTRDVDVSRYAGWSRGLLRFDGEPLAKVVDEVNRYALEQVRLHDPELGRLPIYGVLHVGDTKGLVSIVQDSQGLSRAALEEKLTIASRDGE